MTYRIGVTPDLRADDGACLVDIGLAQVRPADGLSWEFIETTSSQLTATDVACFDTIFAWDTPVCAATVAAPQRLVHVARLGVRLDAVDVDACTQAGVLVTTTPDAVRRPVASAALAFLLALSHRVTTLDRAARARDWQPSGAGRALSGRTLGIVGLGNIGSECVRLIEPWQMHVVAADPQPAAEPPAKVALTSLDDLLRVSDFVVIACPLTERTRHLIDGKRLALMKPTSYLINVARGAIVDTTALVGALAAGRIAGAALDVLEHEPPAPGDPLLSFENVILSPHAAAVTDEFNLGVGESALASARAVSRGQIPEHLVNPEVLSHPRLAGRPWRAA